MRITVVNNSETHKVFNTVKYTEEAYSNSNISFRLEGIMMGGHAVIEELEDHYGSRIYAIIPDNWEVGAPDKRD